MAGVRVYNRSDTVTAVITALGVSIAPGEPFEELPEAVFADALADSEVRAQLEAKTMDIQRMD